MKTMHGKQGFTFTEIMIVVFIMGMLVSMAVPSISRARDRAQIRVCQSNLRVLNEAAQQYLFVNPNPGTLTPVDLSAYFFKEEAPECPAGGSYTVHTDPTITPICSLSAKGHRL